MNRIHLVQKTKEYGKHYEEIFRKEKKIEHLCDTCMAAFPECQANEIIFSIDRNPVLRGEEADKVVECDAYVKDDYYAR